LNNNKIIEVTSLTKDFKDLRAVNNLNLNVFEGDVFGFLGPNGAGKSTTIRMLMSLIKPDQGTINFFGKPLRSNRKEILSRIGAIVEKPDFYGYLSAYKNLEILGKLSGKEINKNRIMEVLELVGLSSRYKSKVKTFSHGMKQRLGIGQALLHDPDLIILDEPTTGLDPQGMKEIRDLILYLSSEKKKTILLSSHILYEVELVANRMVIINKGKTKVEGEVKDLLNTKKLKVSIDVDNEEKTFSLVNQSQWKDKFVSNAKNIFIFSLENDEIPQLNKYFVENGIAVSSVIPTRSLEDYFFKILDEAA
jgi:ABC-type multidrug transport system ATPase subunit